MKLYEAQICLAVTHVRLYHVVAAGDTCKAALEGRRRVMGRDHDSFLESLALMSLIHELQGNQFRTQIYLTMIFEAKFDILKAKYQNLTCPEALDERPDSVPVVPLLSKDVAGLGMSTLAVHDRATEPRLVESSHAGAEAVAVERVDLLVPDRPPLFSAHSEDADFAQNNRKISKNAASPPLPAPPSTAIPYFGRDKQKCYGFHQRNTSAPQGSQTVPGSPLLTSPRVFEPALLTARPLGATGLFRGVSSSGAEEVLDVLRVWVNTGWNVNRPLSLRSSHHGSVMHRLVDATDWPFERRAVMSFCLESGWDVENATFDGKTVHQRAVELKDSELLEFLVKAGVINDEQQSS